MLAVSVNPIFTETWLTAIIGLGVNHVSVNMGFTLTASNGRVISDTEARSSSYAGSDVHQMALTLVNEKADEVVAMLYADYCRNAGKPK